MSNVEKIQAVKTLLGVTDDSEDERIATYLDLAALEILGWRYSYSAKTPSTVPAEYENVQIQAVLTGYTLAGAEGQVQHYENGLQRTFKYETMVGYIRANVVPIVKVV